MGETKDLRQIPSLSKVCKIEEGRFKMGNNSIQLTRATHWAKRRVESLETLPSLQIKENFPLIKNFTKYKIALKVS